MYLYLWVEIDTDPDLTKLCRSFLIRNHHTDFYLSFENNAGMVLFFRSKMRSLWRPWTSMWKLWQRRKRGPIQKKLPSTLNPGRWKKRFQKLNTVILYIEVVLWIYVYWSLSVWSGSRRTKKVKQFSKCLHVLFLREGGFSCSLDVLRWGLGIYVLQFFI